MNFSRFFMNFEDFSWFFFLHFISVHHFAMIISCISRYYYNCFHIAPYLKVWTFHCCMHSLEIQCIQQWIQSIRQIVTCWTAYIRKRSKMSTNCHQKHVHEKSPKKRTFCGHFCPRNVAKSVHEMSPLLSTKCHLICPRNVCHPLYTVRWCSDFWSVPSSIL